MGLFKLEAEAKAAFKRWGEMLTQQTRAHIVEEAHKRLHTRRTLFVENLQPLQVDDNTWALNLSAKVRWIDDGLKPHNMVDDLLKSKNAKTAKDGSNAAASGVFALYLSDARSYASTVIGSRPAFVL